jgi:hypothetical protein
MTNKRTCKNKANARARAEAKAGPPLAAKDDN